MPTHIVVNSLGLTYKGTIGISIATIPDVCKTPSPGGPVPVPYPNFANQSTLRKGTTTVKAKGKMIAVKGSQFGMSTGDEAGTVGGVKSNTFKQATDWITYSFDVKMDGKNACRHTDKKFHNNKNTVNLQGETDPQAPVGGDNPLEIDCKDKFDKCETEELCAKCAELNKQAKAGNMRRITWRKDAQGPNRGQTDEYKIKRMLGSAHTSMLQKKYHSTGESDIPFNDVSKECKEELEGKEKKGNFDIDHTQEIQVGGLPTDSSNLRWLSKSVNRSMGSTMNLYCAPTDLWGRDSPKGGPHTGVRPNCC